MDMNDGAPEPDLIINHLNQNHYSSDSSLDSEVDQLLGSSNHQENHTGLEPQDLLHRDDGDDGEDGDDDDDDDDEENGRSPDGELPPGSEDGMDMLLMEEQPPRYLSPTALKKHIHEETTKVNNELRVLITKEIRKPGRRK